MSGRICKDCKNFEDIGIQGFPVLFTMASSRYRCQRRKEFDVVHGEVTDSRDAWDERRKSWFFDKCGPDGKYWTVE